MRIHTTTQIEYDDGSMSRPFAQVQVYEKPPQIKIICRTAMGVTYTPDVMVLAHADSTLRFTYELIDEDDFLSKTDQLDLCFEQESSILTYQTTENSTLYCQVIDKKDAISVVTFMLIDKYGGQSNKVKFTIKIV